jgi:hypothetical protein
MERPLTRSFLARLEIEDPSVEFARRGNVRHAKDDVIEGSHLHEDSYRVV